VTWELDEIIVKWNLEDIICVMNYAFRRRGDQPIHHLLKQPQVPQCVQNNAGYDLLIIEILLINIIRKV